MMILVLLAVLVPIASAGAPEVDLESLLADAVPGPMEGVSFSVQKVGAGAEARPEYLNIYPYLAYTSAAGVEFYEPQVNDFTVGGGEMWLNDYVILLNNDTCGIAVLHLLVDTGGFLLGNLAGPRAALWSGPALKIRGPYHSPSCGKVS